MRRDGSLRWVTGPLRREATDWCVHRSCGCITCRPNRYSRPGAFVPRTLCTLGSRSGPDRARRAPPRRHRLFRYRKAPRPSRAERRASERRTSRLVGRLANARAIRAGAHNLAAGRHRQGGKSSARSRSSITASLGRCMSAIRSIRPISSRREPIPPAASLSRTARRLTS